MKKIIITACIIFALGVAAIGVGMDVRTASSGQVRGKGTAYSNLVDEGTQQEVKELLSNAGVLEGTIQTFLDWVNDFNERVGKENLAAEGFTSLSEGEQADYSNVYLKTRYLDSGYMQMDPNCRLTSYLLFHDFVKTGTMDEEVNNYLMFDEFAIENDPVYEPLQANEDEFLTLFNSVEVEEGSKFEDHVKAIQAAWEQRKISFEENENMKFVAIFIHDPFENLRFVGHAGLLINSGDCVYFLEKCSSGQPYQLTRFETADDFKQYLFAKGEFNGDGTEDEPIIMVNDVVLS